MNVITPKRPITSETERAKRKAAVDYARGGIRLEGFIPSAFSDALDRRFIDGEITVEEKIAALKEHYKDLLPQPKP